MIYIYSPKGGNDVVALSTQLNATILRQFDGMHFWRRREKVNLFPEDVVVRWGGELGELDGPRVINPIAYLPTGYAMLKKLTAAGLSTAGAYHTPQRENGMLPRSGKSVHGDDLMFGCPTPSYWSVKVDFGSEIRVHVFNEKIIKIGKRTPVPGFTVAEEGDWKPESGLAHPWIRTALGGWTVVYGPMKLFLNDQLKRTVNYAMKAVGLSYGMVDIGLPKYGGYLTMDVSGTPDLANEAIMNMYVQKLRALIDKAEVVEEPEEEDVVPDL